MNTRIIFFSVAILVLFFICFFTARVYVYGFNLGNHPAKNIIVAALFLPILYIGGLLGARTANGIGRIPYIVINIIAGIFFYFFIGALALGIVSIGFLAFGQVHIPLAISWIILSLSLVAAIAGFIQATMIRVARYTVILPHAPASWDGKTAALISDTHFGLINYTKFSDKVVSTLLRLNPDFVLHAGDFYDGPIVDTAPLTASWKKLTEKIPLFYTPGNHEAYGDYTMFVDSVRAAGATVLDDKMVDYEGVNIIGTLYHGGKENPDMAKVLASLSIDPEKPAILINHPPTDFLAPAEHNINLIVSGHTHRGQFWPLRYITRKVYGAFDYGMHPYHENLISITSNGIGTYGPPMRLWNKPEIVFIHFKNN